MNWTLHCGDALSVLRTLPAQSVQCVCTSPPYWGLRDYGHADQIGLEPTPDAFVAALVGVFGEVRRVLADDGVCWLNVGDSYAGGGTVGRNDTTPEALARRAAQFGTGTGAGSAVGRHGTRPRVVELKPKDLVGVPWRAAFALQADGWYLRSDVIWSKPNPMPESVTDRPTKAHEYVFLLTKSARYFYDADAIRQPNTIGTLERLESGPVQAIALGPKNAACRRDGNLKPYTGLATKDYESANAQDPSEPKRRVLATMSSPDYSGANARTVWTIPTEASPYEHFAVMPKALARKCIMAGCKQGETVLDPFAGVATTGVVALEEGRSFVGIELNPKYAAMARERLANVAPLLATEIPA
jgi:DNA modification methylase